MYKKLGQELRKACFEIGEPQEPVPSPEFKQIPMKSASNSSFYNPKIHKVPDLDFFHLKPECEEQQVCLFPGGETKALELFNRRLSYEIKSFKRGKINPNLSKPIIFTKETSLSPYLRHGCLSVRNFYWEVKKAYLKVNY
jgi:deoxyribodipyrimidine photolyase